TWAGPQLFSLLSAYSGNVPAFCRVEYREQTSRARNKAPSRGWSKVGASADPSRLAKGRTSPPRPDSAARSRRVRRAGGDRRARPPTCKSRQAKKGARAPRRPKGRLGRPSGQL